MIGCDNIILAAGLDDFFKNLCKKGLNASEKMPKNVLKNLRQALEIGADVGSAFASRSPKAASSTLPDAINFYQTGKGFYLVGFVQVFFKLSNYT